MPTGRGGPLCPAVALHIESRTPLFHVLLRFKQQLFSGLSCLAVLPRGGRSVLRKRTKSIRFDNSFRSLKEPLQHLPDSNGFLYCLQLNTYRYILETEYGMRVSGMYLAQVHPCLARARLIEVPRMEEEMALVVEDQIDKGEALSGALPDAPFTLPPPQKEVACIARECIGVSACILACVRARALPSQCCHTLCARLKR